MYNVCKSCFLKIFSLKTKNPNNDLYFLYLENNLETLKNYLINKFPANEVKEI